MKIEVYVCPECGEWSELTSQGFPQFSTCGSDHHPEAVRVEFESTFESKQEQQLVRALYGGVHPNDPKPRSPEISELSDTTQSNRPGSA